MNRGKPSFPTWNNYNTPQSTPSTTNPTTNSAVANNPTSQPTQQQQLNRLPSNSSLQNPNPVSNSFLNYASLTQTQNTSPETIDMNEFPALGSTGLNGSSNNAPFMSSYASTLNSADLNGPPGVGRGSGLGSSSIGFSSDDFPALPGTNAVGSGGNTGSSMAVGGASSGSAGLGIGRGAGFLKSQTSLLNDKSYATKVSSANAGSTPAPGLGPISNSNVMNGLPSISSGSSFSSQNLTSIQSPPPSSSSTLLSGSNANVQDSTLPPSDKHGLLGLLSVIRMTDPDMNALALGTDLTTLGLNLNSPDALYATFTTPFSDNPHHSFTGAPIEPEYHLPSCYYVQLPPPTAQKIGSFSDETLFYMFYALPRDALQEAAAQELYNRSWRYHKELKLWLTKDPSGETALKTNVSERSTFIFFDVANWEKVKKEYTLVYDALEERPSGVPSGSVIGSAPGGVVGVNPTTTTTGNVIGSNIGGNVLGGGLGLGGLGGLGGIGLPVSNNVGSLQMLQQQQQLHHQFASGLQTSGVGGVTGLGL